MATSDGAATELSRDDVRRLYEEQRASLFRLAVLVGADRELAQDAVQDAFLALWRRPEQVRDPAAVLPWLRTVVCNGVRSSGRQSTRTRGAVIVGPDGGKDQTAQSANVVAVAAALAQLPERQRLCVVLRYWAGLSDAEAAAVTGLSLGTVKTHVRRGLQRLQEVLPDDD